MADAIWERKFRGEYVSLSLDDITNHRMRELKSAFGDKYGIPSQFVSLLLIGDADALTGALWIHGQVAKKPIGDLLAFDWNVSEFDEPDKPKRAPKSKPPTKAATGDETTSTETPENSGDDSSSS